MSCQDCFLSFLSCCSITVFWCVYIVSMCLLSITYATDEDSCIAVEMLVNKIFKTSIGEMLHEIMGIYYML